MFWRCARLLSDPVPPPMLFVDRIDRLVVPDFAAIGDDLDLVVEDHDAVLVIDRQDGVADLEVEVLDRDDAHFAGSSPRYLSAIYLAME